MKETISPDDFTNVGGDEVPDELLHVVVDGSAFLNGCHNGREVVVSQDHLSGRLGHSCSGSHGNTNLSLLQCRCVIHSVTSLHQINQLSYVSTTQTNIRLKKVSELQISFDF